MIHSLLGLPVLLSCSLYDSRLQGCLTSVPSQALRGEALTWLKCADMGSSLNEGPCSGPQCSTAYRTLIRRDPSLEQEVESATNESFGPASLGPGTAQPEVRRAVPGSSV